jgi:hypothetical protein
LAQNQLPSFFAYFTCIYLIEELAFDSGKASLVAWIEQM